MSVEKEVPEIRFKGFSGEWDSNSVGALCDFIVPGRNKPQIFNGDIPWVTTPDIMSNCVSKSKIGLAISKEEAKRVGAKIVPTNSIIISCVGDLGLVAKVDNDLIINQQLHAFIPKRNINNWFLLYELVTRKKYMENVATKTAVPYMNKDNCNSIPISFPEEKEQTQIGNYFQKLDTLINQHQQKHDKLSSIKKAMLEKIFPKSGETVPQIRFKGFTGAWEEKGFSVCFANIPNNTLSRAKLNYEAGMAKNIHYGDVLIKFDEVLDARKEVLPFITSDEVTNKLKHTALKNGDIIIADAAEDSTVGKCTELFNVHEQLVFSGLHTIAVRPNLPFASKYLGYYLNSSSYHNQLLPLMQGTKVLSISKTAIQNTNVKFPKSDKEQAAIGNYFQKLDALINQHQQQITKLNNIKQACLSKMFV